MHEETQEKIPTVNLYVSRMCGIRAYWDAKLEVCISIPPQKMAVEESSESFEYASESTSVEKSEVGKTSSTTHNL